MAIGPSKSEVVEHVKEAYVWNGPKRGKTLPLQINNVFHVAVAPNTGYTSMESKDADLIENTENASVYHLEKFSFAIDYGDHIENVFAHCWIEFTSEREYNLAVMEIMDGLEIMGVLCEIFRL